METGQRVVVYVPQEQHRKLKGKLSSQGMTVSEWFRDRVAEELSPRSEITPNEHTETRYFEVGEVSGTGVPAIKCALPVCRATSTAMGKFFNPDDQEWSDQPMCKEHAAKSLKEFSKAL